MGLLLLRAAALVYLPAVGALLVVWTWREVRAGLADPPAYRPRHTDDQRPDPEATADLSRWTR